MLNYETLKLKIRPKEAQLSHIGAHYSSKEAQISSYEPKATWFSKIVEYIRKGCLFTMRVDKLSLNSIEIRRLSRPKSPRNL